jgi:hypothetical protein
MNAEVIRGNSTQGLAQIIHAVGLSNTAIGFNEFINLRLHGGGTSDFDNGFYIESPNNLIEGCEIYDAVGAAIQIYNAKGRTIPNNTIVRNNVVRDFTRLTNQRSDGVIVGGGTGAKIYNNIFYNLRPNASGSAAIHVFDADNTEVYNNTVYGNVPPGILVETYSSGSIIRNNITYNNTGGNYVNRGNNTAASNNLVGVDPQFENPSSKDFQLKSASPAIDAGMTTQLVRTDMVGTPRPQGGNYDIGAYEYRSLTASSPPAPPTNVRIAN